MLVTYPTTAGASHGITQPLTPLSTCSPHETSLGHRALGRGPAPSHDHSRHGHCYDTPDEPIVNGFHGAVIQAGRKETR